MPEPRPNRFVTVPPPAPGAGASRVAPPPGPSRREALLALLGPLPLAAGILAAALDAAETGIAGIVLGAVAGLILIASLLREITERDLRGFVRWLPLPALPFLWDRPLSLAMLIGLRQLVMTTRTLLPLPAVRRFNEYLWTHPVEFLAIGFAVVIALGALLLMLPVAGALPQGVSAVDALFTSTSATCVTGLTVLDTATAYSPVGWAIIAGLIQIGGIGVMALSTLAAVVAGRGLGLAQSGAVAASMETTAAVDSVRIVRVVAGVTLAAEGIGALILTLYFLPDLPFLQALGYGVFHSVSAFCNAGFALWSDNLMSHAAHLTLVTTISLLIILGGLGFLVITEVGPWLLSRRRRRRPLSLHARLVLAVTGLLLLGGTVLFAVIEWHGSLAHLPWYWKLSNAWFQSVSTRTAGFNTVDFTALAPATVFIIILLMFIGASPGSTGGGVKTTTTAVVAAAVRAYVRGRDTVEIGGRSVSAGTVVRALTLLFVSVLTVAVGFFLLLLTQDLPFDSLLFESVSAFATVGLSVGATPQLDDAGKLVVVAMMYVGRVGPLTLILLLGSTSGVAIRVPEEPVALS